MSARSGTPSLSQWQVDELPRRRAQGQTVTAIAADFGVSRRTVQRYQAARWSCGHCRTRFATARDLFAHAVAP